MLPRQFVEEYRDIWRVWADRVEARRGSFHAPAALRKRMTELGNEKIAFIIGAGMSSVSGRFWDMWDEYKSSRRTLTEDPQGLDGFVDLLEYGGLAAVPVDGIDTLPDLVEQGAVPLMLVLNYNCHIEICLSMCGTGYRSVAYDGRRHNEVVEVGSPKCLILKPHGTSRLFGRPTSIVWPDKSPDENYSIFDMFVDEVERSGIRHVVILAYSCTYDEYVKPYLTRLNELGVTVWQIEKFAECQGTTLPVEWGIVRKKNLIQNLRNGAVDFLDALVEVCAPRRRPCAVSKDPLAAYQDTMLKHTPKVTIVSSSAT